MKKIRKYEILSLIIIGIILLIYQFNTLQIFEFENFKNFIENFGILGPIIFILIYIIATLIGLSNSAFTILGGLLFDFKIGFITTLIASTLSSTIAFYTARHFSEKLKIKAKQKKKQEKETLISKLINKIKKSTEKHQFLTILFLRLSFMPYIELSYAAGFVKQLKAKNYLLATFIANVFESFVLIYLGTSITQNIVQVLIAISLFILFISIPRIIKHRTSRK